MLQPLYALPQLTVFWGSVTQLRYSSEYQRNRNDRYFCVSQSIAISDNVNWFSKLGYFFIYSLNECFEEKKVSFLIIFLVRTDYIFWDIFGASILKQTQDMNYLLNYEQFNWNGNIIYI